jgi:L,D-transpeptidase catalytic domain
MRPLAAFGLTLLGAVAAVTAAAATVDSTATVAPVAVGALPTPPAPAFTPGTPRPLGSVRHLSHWAPVRRATIARSAPDDAAPAVAELATTTPEGTRNAVAVLALRQDGHGATWLHIRLPVLPNGATGWVRRRALGALGTADTRVDVDLTRLRLTLYRDGRPSCARRSASGVRAGRPPEASSTSATSSPATAAPRTGRWPFGTSARSPTATGWPAGGFVGIHGTNRPDLVPGRVSHGCIRMRNPDVVELAKRLPVGTPLTIH